MARIHLPVLTDSRRLELETGGEERDLGAQVFRQSTAGKVGLPLIIMPQLPQMPAADEVETPATILLLANLHEGDNSVMPSASSIVRCMRGTLPGSCG